METVEMSAAPFPRGVPVARGEFQINSFTRAWDDSCEVSQQIRDSSGPGKYMVTNLVPKEAGAAKLAQVNPTILGREGFGLNNSRIDDDSRIRNEATQAGRQRCPLRSGSAAQRGGGRRCPARCPAQPGAQACPRAAGCQRPEPLLWPSLWWAASRQKGRGGGEEEEREV